MPTFLILICSVLALTFFGAGVLPGILQPVAVLLCLGCILVRGGGCRRLGWLSFSAMALVALVFFTTVPLPSVLARAFTGKDVVLQNDLVRKAADEAALMGLVEPGEKHFSISRNRAGTLRIVLLLLAGFAAAALAGRLSSQWKYRYVLFLAAFGAAVAVAGYASQRVFPQGKNLWWLFPVEHGSPIGCFINRNHFGGFVAMLCPVAAVLLVESVSRRKYLESAAWVFCFGSMNLAVIMSLSRGAWLAYAAAGTVLVGFLMFRRRVAAALGLLAVIVVAAFAVILPARQELAERVITKSDSSPEASRNFRLATWRDTLRILPDYPCFGTGANGLRMILPQYRQTTTRREADHAENEYVQVPVEFGLFGVALVAALCVLAALQWRQNSAAGNISTPIGMAVGGAVAVVMAHAAVDFAIRVPLYFVVFCSMLGLVTGPAGSEADGETARSPNWFRSLMARAAVPAAGILIVGLVSLFGRMPYELDSDGYLGNAGAQALVRALEWSPTSWRGWYCLGNVSVGLKARDEVRFGERCLARAAQYDPKNYLLWQRLAEVRLGMGNKSGAKDAYSQAKSLRSWVKMPELE